MSNVFISHSSQDKPFVRKLAVALLSEGLPVWLDSWELAAGDSLIDGVYDGIDGSSAVVLVISKTSIASGWVDRELNAALAKENATGRKFLIPIKVEDCEPPLKVADRIFVDFSKHGSFSQPLSVLSRELVAKGLREMEVAPERELFGLSFTRGVHLNTTALSAAMDHVSRRHSGRPDVHPDQIVFSTEADYDLLLSKMHENIDTIGDRAEYSPELERSLRDALNGVHSIEEDLRRGIALLLSRTHDKDAWYWFAKLKRAEAVSTLYSYQLSADSVATDFGKEWSGTSLVSNTSAARFFDVDSVQTVNFWRTAGGPVNHFSAWVDRDICQRNLLIDGKYYGPEPYHSVFFGEVTGKYILPQMVNQHVRGGENAKDPIWNLDEATIGMA